ncbi:EamA family transporter [Fluviicola sp.]|uniref:EamA family transporter n=1 Tax=Fluviicola sp. TaxID=1917219 RepID=UPI003D2A812F
MSKLRGALFVGLGAASYGILATIVKYANNHDAHTSILTFYQSLVGVIVLFVLMQAAKRKKTPVKATLKSKSKLILFGISMGLTSCFYYISIQTISVSIGIILLMQSIWMSVVWEMIQTRKVAHWLKIVGSFCVLGGTILATNLIQEDVHISVEGIVYGLLAALSYTISMHASNHVETQLSSVVRSFWLIVGSLLMVIVYWNIQIWEHLDWMIFLKFGIILGLFGTVIPPILFNIGIPKTGLGLAGILAAIEIPVSICSAQLILHETVTSMQWLGVGIIIATVVVINARKTE